MTHWSKALRAKPWSWKPGYASIVSLSGQSRFCYSSLTTPSHEEAPEERLFEYNWIDGAEVLEKYVPGGYHPIMIGDVLHSRYHIVDKLGFGGYSTVWLARDTRFKRYVAVKVSIADASCHETKILRALAQHRTSSLEHPGRDAIPLPLDQFEISGPNGTHQCYTMHPAQCSLKDVAFCYLFPLEVTRALSYHLTLAIAYTHSQGYVHGDVHLRNILVKLPSSLDQFSIEEFYKTYGKPHANQITQRDGKPLPPNIPPKAVVPVTLGPGKEAEEYNLTDAHILLSDFGEAFNPTSNPRRGEQCHTPLAARPPEALFQPEAPLSFSADIWSLATSIWEILGMKAIFSSEYPSADQVASQQTDILGPIPETWWEGWSERGEFFAILDLMRQMLAFRPEDRPTAEEVPRSEWMVKWCLPDFERSLHLGR